MVRSGIDAFQEELLREFFRHETGYFLTGGAALAGFYFGHRKTQDLDLFTLKDEIEKGFNILREISRKLGATIESLQSHPDFRRVLISRGDESVVVDLVHEYVYQLDEHKSIIKGIRIDSPEEIFANKLCALLSRSEIRDLVDIHQLEKAGYDLESALDAAEKKDSGLSAGQLAWVLNSVVIGDSAKIPGDISLPEIKDYLKDLVERLGRLALPESN